MELNPLFDVILVKFGHIDTGFMVGDALLQGFILDIIPFLFLILLVLISIIPGGYHEP